MLQLFLDRTVSLLPAVSFQALYSHPRVPCSSVLMTARHRRRPPPRCVRKGELPALFWARIYCWPYHYQCVRGRHHGLCNSDTPGRPTVHDAPARYNRPLCQARTTHRQRAAPRDSCAAACIQFHRHQAGQVFLKSCRIWRLCRHRAAWPRFSERPWFFRFQVAARFF